MKNLLWLLHGGLGEREAPNAPTFWKTVEGFVAQGWRVWVIDAGTASDTPLGVRDYGDGLWIRRFNPPFLGMVKKKKIGAVFGLLQILYVQLRLRREAESMIRQQGFTPENTVIYGMETAAVLPAKKLADKYGMKLVTRFYGTVMCDVPYTAYNRLRHYPEFQALGVPSDLLIMTNDGTKGDRVLQRVGNPTANRFFWRNGVDLAEIPEKCEDAVSWIPAEDKVLMTLSRLNKWKHVDRAVSAMPAVLEKHPTARLVVCGYGPEREALEEQAKALGVAERVSFMGNVPHDQVYAYLQRANIFLSLYDLSNLGNPIFEAMRAGLPLITLNVGDTATVISDGENGVLLPAYSPEGLAEAVCRLLDDPAEAARLGDAALRFANENFWTWDERVAAEIREVTKLLKGE